jgi:hypothetical protein
MCKASGLRLACLMAGAVVVGCSGQDDAIEADISGALATEGAMIEPTATGGGCGMQHNHRWGHHYACISAPGPGSARADGYVQMYDGHPRCSLTIEIADARTGQPLKHLFDVCPTGAFFRHMVAPDISATSGRYFSRFKVRYFDRDFNAASPSLTLP